MEEHQYMNLYEQNRKMYSIFDVNNCENSVYNGNAEFKDTLFNKKVIRYNMKVIKSYKHKMYASSSNETSL